jgi:hypothetical protein
MSDFLKENSAAEEGGAGGEPGKEEKGCCYIT